MDLRGLGDERWRLRKPEPSDLAAVTAHVRHPDSSWIGGGYSDDPGLPARVLQTLRSTGESDYYLACDARDPARIIGMLTLIDRADGVVEVVYGVAPAERNRGLATDLLRTVTQALLARHRPEDIVLIIDPRNAVSQRVAEKAGYTRSAVPRTITDPPAQQPTDLVYVPGGRPAGHPQP